LSSPNSGNCARSNAAVRAPTPLIAGEIARRERFKIWLQR